MGARSRSPAQVPGGPSHACRVRRPAAPIPAWTALLHLPPCRSLHEGCLIDAPEADAVHTGTPRAPGPGVVWRNRVLSGQAAARASPEPRDPPLRHGTQLAHIGCERLRTQRRSVTDTLGPVHLSHRASDIRALAGPLGRASDAEHSVRGCYRGTRCEPGWLRRHAGIGRSAVYRSVCSAGRASGVITLSPEFQGACWRALFEPGSGSLAGGIVGRMHPDDRRPQVKTGAAQVAAPT